MTKPQRKALELLAVVDQGTLLTTHTRRIASGHLYVHRQVGYKLIQLGYAVSDDGYCIRITDIGRHALNIGAQ